MLQSTRESLDIRKVRRPLPPVPNVSPIKHTHINKPVVGTLLIKTGISSTPKKPTVSAPLTTVIVTIPKPDPVGFISKPLPCASTTPIISKISEIPKQLGTDVTPKVIKDVPKIQIKETPKKIVDKNPVTPTSKATITKVISKETPKQPVTPRAQLIIAMATSKTDEINKKKKTKIRSMDFRRRS